MNAAPKKLVNRYIPQPRQKAFHSCPAREILYGGAAGGGKTMALIGEGYQYCVEHPGSRVIFFRRNTNHLRKPKLDAKMLIPRHVAAWSERDQMFRFRNANEEGRHSEFIFSHMDTEDHALAHQGEEYDLILWDEFSHFTEFQQSYLRSRSRTVIDGSSARILAASNPGGISHVAIRERFIEPKVMDAELIAWYDTTREVWCRFPPGTRGRPTENIVWLPEVDDATREDNEQRAAEGLPPLPRRSRCFIPAKLKDNKYYHESGDYQATLRELDPETQRRLLEGDWSAFEGQAFREFNELLHIEEATFLPPAHWPRWRSMDYGYAAPLCVLWHAMDPDTEMIVTYEELYYSLKAAREGNRDACQRILAKTPADDMILQTAADPSMWSGGQGDSGAESHATIFAKHGVELTRANNHRITGKSRVHEMLRINPQTGRPNWVVTRNCRNLIRTLPNLVVSDRNPEDIDTQTEDHAYDALRYGLMAKPSAGAPRFGEIRAAAYRTYDQKVPVFG